MAGEQTPVVMNRENFGTLYVDALTIGGTPLPFVRITVEAAGPMRQ